MAMFFIMFPILMFGWLAFICLYLLLIVQYSSALALDSGVWSRFSCIILPISRSERKNDIAFVSIACRAISRTDIYSFVFFRIVSHVLKNSRSRSFLNSKTIKF